VVWLWLAGFAVGAYLVWSGREFIGAGLIIALIAVAVETDLLA